MCGIAGIVATGAERPAIAAVDRMLGALAHRGPDDQGCVALGAACIGMRRLSILDLGPRGHQPMSSADGRYTIVHNGEIYNFLELADELRALGRRFTTTTDTEVILAAYDAWGPACLERFNGIWAFAIWDARDEALFVARDRVGVKPLFLAEGSGQLAFASEIKALRELPWVSDDPRHDVVREYLIDGTSDRAGATFYRDIESFPPAHALVVTSHDRRWTRYWSPTAGSTDASLRASAGDADRVDQFRALLVDSIGLQLRSDVPIGSCLSGGLDSSSIVCIASAMRRGELAAASDAHRERDAIPQLAFFAEFREAGIDERPYVDAVVEATGVTLHTTSPDSQTFLSSLERVLEAQDEPFGSLSILAQYHVMRIAHEAGVKVLLDGQGADELLAGYSNYNGIRTAGALRSGDPRTMLDASMAVIGGRAPWRSTLGYTVLGHRTLPSQLIRGRMPLGWLGAAVGRSPSEDRSVDASGTLLAAKLWREIVSDNLPKLLRYEDRNSMAFGIEARVPFLDHRLIEASMALPDRLKIDRFGRRKAILRRAMAGIVPDVVLRRTDKVAFQPPERRWLIEAEPAWRRLVPGSRAESSGLLAEGTLTKAINAFGAGRIGGNVLWRILNLELWMRGPRGRSLGG